MSTPNIRAALERLVSAYDNNEGLPIAEWIDTARNALAPEPVREGPSDEELLESAAKALGYKSIPSDETCLTAEAGELLAFARAVLARWGRPAAPPAPEPGEVGELVAMLRREAHWKRVEATAPIFTEHADRIDRAATLLEQLSAPAPVAEPVSE